MSDIKIQGAKAPPPTRQLYFKKEAEEKRYFFGLFKRKVEHLVLHEKVGSEEIRHEDVKLKLGTSLFERLIGQNRSFCLFQNTAQGRLATPLFLTAKKSLDLFTRTIGGSLSSSIDDLALGEGLTRSVENYLIQKAIHQGKKLLEKRNQDLTKEKRVYLKRTEDPNYVQNLKDLEEKYAPIKGTRLNERQQKLFHDYKISRLDSNELEIAKIEAVARKIKFKWQAA